MNSIVAPETICKHPDESLVLQMDFFNLLEEGESITSVAGVAVDPNEESGGPAIASPTIAGSAVRIRVTGGTAASDYRVTVEVDTSEANRRVGIGILQVSD